MDASANGVSAFSGSATACRAELRVRPRPGRSSFLAEVADSRPPQPIPRRLPDLRVAVPSSPAGLRHRAGRQVPVRAAARQRDRRGVEEVDRCSRLVPPASMATEVRGISWIVRHPVLTALLSAAVAASAGFAGDIVFHRTWLIVACAAVAQLALTVPGSVRADAAVQMPPRVLTVGLALAALAGVTVVVAATGWTRWWLYLSLGPVLNLLLPATVDELDDRAGAGRRRVAGTRTSAVVAAPPLPGDDRSGATVGVPAPVRPGATPLPPRRACAVPAARCRRPVGDLVPVGGRDPPRQTGQAGTSEGRVPYGAGRPRLLPRRRPPVRARRDEDPRHRVRRIVRESGVFSRRRRENP